MQDLTPTATGDDAPDPARRAERRARAGMWLALAALLASLLSLGLSQRSEGGALMPGIMVVHGVVILLAILATRSLRRLKKAGSPVPIRVTPLLRPLLAPWVLALGLAGVAAVTTVLMEGGLSSFSTRASSDDQHFFVSIDREPEHEISESEYQGYERRIVAFFACAWTVVSYAALLQWRFVALAWRAQRAPSSSLPGDDAPEQPPAPMAEPSWKSTALIAGLWMLGLVGGLLAGVWQTMGLALCEGKLAPGSLDLMMGLPLVFLPVGALFVKQAPYNSPWLAAWVDELYGGGAYERFITRLKPMLLFGASILVNALALAQGCAGQGGATGGVLHLPFPCLFFASAGVGMMLAYVVMRLRGLPGV